MENKILPVGLKGNEINERMKQLMGIQPINENKKTSAVELTKLGPDGNVYAIVRENHEYYIKTTSKKNNLVTEDFSYIGGLMNKKSEAYPSYAKAIKQLNLKFNSLNEAYGKSGQINVFEDDNLLNEMGYGFSGEGNLEGNKKSDCCGGQVMEGTCMECGGSAYGAMNEKKYSDEASEFISKEISHLMKDKGYKQDRAVAAALNVAREKGYKVPEKSDEGVELGENVENGSLIELLNYVKKYLSSRADADGDINGGYTPNTEMSLLMKVEKILDGDKKYLIDDLNDLYDYFEEENQPEFLQKINSEIEKINTGSKSAWKDFDSAAHLANWDRQQYGDMEEEVELSEIEQAVEDMMAEKEYSRKQQAIAALDGDKDEIDAADLAALRAGRKPKSEGRLSIEKAISEMDGIIESVVGSLKKKV